MSSTAGVGAVTFDTSPERYRHWKLSIEGRIATLALDVDEDAGVRPGYKLKLNSYDLGVDIELHDALQRIRFEHPAVRVVVITSGNARSFCAGANIYMLGTSSHRWKVNFCKFTNETRNGMEDSSAHDGLRFLAAVNGACAGGGYELALACDEIVMIDDRRATVSLPEVPLLGVLPGTGGLTRLVDKRRVRRDLADLFCTNADGVRAARALEWGLIDALAPPTSFAALVRERAQALEATSARGADTGIALRPLVRELGADRYHYPHLDLRFERSQRSATLTVRAPSEPQPDDVDAIVARGSDWWPLATARELDDALLLLRTNEPELGVIVLRTAGDPDAVLAVDRVLAAHRAHWLVRETVGLLRRTLARLETTSRTLFALSDGESAFAGTLFELALAADRTYLLDAADGGGSVALSAMNFGAYPTLSGATRLETRFAGRTEPVAALERAGPRRYGPAEALAAGLVTLTPDELDWDEEVRVALEERAAISPDALTGLEANLRFPGAESPATKVFGRLTAWQNWVFARPSATGEHGALTAYGTGSKPQLDPERV